MEPVSPPPAAARDLHCLLVHTVGPPGGITISRPTSTRLRLTIPARCSCVFVAGAAKGTGTGGCVPGTVSAGGKQMDFVWATSQAARVSFQVTC